MCGGGKKYNELTDYFRVGQVTRSTCRRSARWLASVPRTLRRRSACCTWRPPPRSRTTWRSSSWTWPPNSSARPSTTSWTTTRRPPRPARASPSATWAAAASTSAAEAEAATDHATSVGIHQQCSERSARWHSVAVYVAECAFFPNPLHNCLAQVESRYRVECRSFPAMY